MPRVTFQDPCLILAKIWDVPLSKDRDVGVILESTDPRLICREIIVEYFNLCDHDESTLQTGQTTFHGSTAL